MLTPPAPPLIRLGTERVEKRLCQALLAACRDARALRDNLRFAYTITLSRLFRELDSRVDDLPGGAVTLKAASTRYSWGPSLA